MSEQHIPRGGLSAGGFTAAAQVIEQGLKEAVRSRGAKRAFVVCSPSVNRRTDTVRRIAAALGDRYAGVYDGIEKDFDLRLGARSQGRPRPTPRPTC